MLVYLKTGSANFTEIGRTETIDDCLAPNWVKRFELDYFFELSQELRVEVYDSDGDSKNLQSHDFLGACTFIVANLVGAPGGLSSNKLLDRKGRDIPGYIKKNPAIVQIACEHFGNENEFVRLDMEAIGLPKMDFFGKADGYLEIYRLGPNNALSQVYVTEVVKNNLNPIWKQACLKVSHLCLGDYKKPFLIKAWDWNSNGHPEFIGQVTFTVEQLKESKMHTCSTLGRRASQSSTRSPHSTVCLNRSAQQRSQKSAQAARPAQM